MYATRNIIFGFHGCDRSVADQVFLRKKPLRKSENDYDWLGHGIYFWQDDERRALEWAKNSPNVNDPAVVGAVINLGKSLDLLSLENSQYLKAAYDLLCSEYANDGRELPTNTKLDDGGFSLIRRLDCSVIQRFMEYSEEEIITRLGLNINSKDFKLKVQRDSEYFDSVRGLFPEGKEVYPASGFRVKDHIQICIRNPNCILAYFEPREPDYDFKKLKE